MLKLLQIISHLSCATYSNLLPLFYENVLDRDLFSLRLFPFSVYLILEYLSDEAFFPILVGLE